MESNIWLFEFIFHNMFGNTIARSVPYFHFWTIFDFFSQSLMHDLCVPSIYSTHDFVSNGYSILGKEGTYDIRLFWYWLLCLCSDNIYSYNACCLNHPLCTSILPNIIFRRISHGSIIRRLINEHTKFLRTVDCILWLVEGWATDK